MISKRDKKEYDRFKNSASKNQYRCMNCCKTVYIPRGKDKVLCSTCGHIIERNEKTNIEHITMISRLQMRYHYFNSKRTNEQIS